MFFFFSSRRRHTRFDCDWSSDVCSSDLLILSKPRTAEEYRKTLAAIDDELKKLTRIVEGLFTLSMADAGQLHLESEPVYINEILEEACALVDRKSTRLNSSHSQISYAVFCLKKKKKRTCNIYINHKTKQLCCHITPTTYNLQEIYHFCSCSGTLL